MIDARCCAHCSLLLNTAQLLAVVVVLWECSGTIKLYKRIDLLNALFSGRDNADDKLNLVETERAPVIVAVKIAPTESKGVMPNRERLASPLNSKVRKVSQTAKVRWIRLSPHITSAWQIFLWLSPFLSFNRLCVVKWRLLQSASIHSIRVPIRRVRHHAIE